MCVLFSVSYDSATSRTRYYQMFSRSVSIFNHHVATVAKTIYIYIYIYIYIRLRRDSSTGFVLFLHSLFILTYQAANCTRKTGSRVPRMTITVLVILEDSVDTHVTVVLVSVNVHVV